MTGLCSYEKMQFDIKHDFATRMNDRSGGKPRIKGWECLYVNVYLGALSFSSMFLSMCEYIWLVYMWVCREVGIECLEVPGHGKGIDYQQGQSYQNIENNHMWSTVQLDGHWYLLDACWGAGKVDIKKKAFIKR